MYENITFRISETQADKSVLGFKKLTVMGSYISHVTIHKSCKAETDYNNQTETHCNNYILICKTKDNEIVEISHEELTEEASMGIYSANF